MELQVMDLLIFLDKIQWGDILAAAVAGYFFGLLWYGVFFNKQFKSLSGVNAEKADKLAIFFQFIVSLLLAYVIYLLGFLDSFLYWIILDGIAALLIFDTLANHLYMLDDNKKAFKLWLIDAFYIIIQVNIIAIILFTI